MPKYSIIVTIYNKEKYLKKCLDSIKNLTFKDFEVILINDGSTDKSMEIAEFSVSGDKRFKLFNTSNQGPSEARNFGISNVTGKYFLFIDSDDYISTDLLKTIDNYIKPDTDLLSFNLRFVDHEGDQKEIYLKPAFNNLNGEISLINFINESKLFDTPVGYVYNTDYFKKHNFKYAKDRLHEDFGLTPLVILKAKNAISIPDVLYNAVLSTDSIVRNDDYQKKLKKANDMIYHFDNLYREVSKGDYQPRTKQVFFSMLANVMILKAKELNKEDQNKYLRKLKDRKISRFLLVDNPKRIIKKTLFRISPKLYLKII